MFDVALRSFAVCKTVASIGNGEHVVAEEERDPDERSGETQYGASVRHDSIRSRGLVSARATAEFPMQLGSEGFLLQPRCHMRGRFLNLSAPGHAGYPCVGSGVRTLIA